MDGEFTGRVVLITGGSGGIGSAMVRSLLENGDRVASIDIVPPEVAPSSSHFMFLQCDVTDPMAVGRAIDMVTDQWGTPDVLVNGAAVATYARFSHDIELRREMEVNYHGAINVIRALLPGMLRKGRGHIHNIGTILSLSGQREMGGYVASKAALAAFTRSLSLDLEGTGIVVNMFYPPLTRTGMTVGSGMPERLMADPMVVGRRLAGRVGSSGKEVFSDPMTMLQAMFLRSFPSLAETLIRSMGR